MSNYSLRVNISPQRALELVYENIGAELVHNERHNLDNGKVLGIYIYEKYYFRVKNRVALVVIADNLKGYTEVRVISTAGSQGLIFGFDWGASASFAGSVERILSGYIEG